MITEIIKINKKNPEIKSLMKAAQLIRRGEIVIFPTETVYGLGADALNEKAVKKIFIAKGRPSDNPLIVHIANKKQLKDLVKRIPHPQKAEKLMRKFWPGPLTLIFEKSEKIPLIVSAGLRTVAIRMPNDVIALELIKMAKTPIAAPSANLSGSPSPTCAEHALLDLRGKVSLIIDGGRTKIGLESTVLDLTTRTPVILRPGKITKHAIEKIIGRIKVYESLLEKRKVKRTKTKIVTKIVKFKSPGMKHRHYAPKAELIIVKGTGKKAGEEVNKLVKIAKQAGKRTGVLKFSREKYAAADLVKYGGRNYQQIARRLFSLLREFDKEKIEVIFSESIERRGLGMAIMDRLERAAHQ